MSTPSRGSAARANGAPSRVFGACRPHLISVGVTPVVSWPGVGGGVNTPPPGAVVLVPDDVPGLLPGVVVAAPPATVVVVSPGAPATVVPVSSPVIPAAT